MAPFSAEIRREIGERDNWECQHCGRANQEGFLMEASHFNHDRSCGYYNDPENGEILCRACHLRRHIDLFIEKGDDWSYQSLRLISNRLYREGLRRSKYYKQHEEDFEADRVEILSIFEEYKMDYFELFPNNSEC